MSRDEFTTRLQALLTEADISDCEKIDLSLVELGRLSIAHMGSTQLGLVHLSGHARIAMETLAQEHWRASLH